MSCNMRLFEYASPPRTATTWVQKACAACYLPDGSKSSIHMIPEGKHDKLWVTTIRHPVEWLVSYWTNIFPGKVSVIEVDALADLPGESFDEFVGAYLDKMPGQIGRMFVAYHADSYLRVEDLPDCWLELLTTLRVPEVFRNRCLAIPKMNATSPKKHKPKVRREIRRAIIDAEEEMIDFFNYR